MKETFITILIDDEPPALRLLEKYAATVPNLNVVATFTDPLEALTYIEKNVVDVVFLDVQMPVLNGIQFSKIVTGVKVIFTTAFSEFALQGYEVNAVDYLLKPFTIERFHQATAKLKEGTANQTMCSPQTSKHLFVKTDGKNNLERVNLDNVFFFESIKNYVAIHHKNGQTITYSTLKRIVASVSNSEFIQIHKSYVVAIKYIEKTNSNSVYVHGKELPLGNTFKDCFFETLEGLKL